MSNSKIVCLDNNITGFVLRNDAHPDDKSKVEQSKALVRYLDEQNKIIMLPTPVITECLVPVAPQDRLRILKAIEKFMVASFGKKAAIKCAEMMHSITHHEIEFKKENKITKSQLKFDYMIAAIAIENGAECIYSHDEGLRKFCEGHITVRSIPDIPEQGKFVLG